MRIGLEGGERLPVQELQQLWLLSAGLLAQRETLDQGPYSQNIFILPRSLSCADFKASFETLDTKLDNIHSTVAAHGQRIDSLESGLTEVSERLELLEATCSGISKDNESLRAKLSDLEGRSRRQNVRIVGLPESIEGPRPTAFFSTLLVEVLGDQILSSPPELDRAHRTPAPKPAPGQRPRPVILRFHRYQVKDLVIRESRKKGVLIYQGHTIRIFDDYSPDVLKLRGEFKEAMAELYKRGLKPALSSFQPDYASR
ncbi:hypothetical protein QQF64_034592 [Cirrhinus molitorella]|uniref:L1 transposable element RRM domain-containing protein n=1 Tax=Cirrhinus molitorella TaxID=172907 RepID=A0ABR3L187_9TELE